MLIDEQYKDAAPEETVARITAILQTLGITPEESWLETGVPHCYSCHVIDAASHLGTNGKGVTKALARASAYGEFIERLQSGLFFYKYQSAEAMPGLAVQESAPDAQYVTQDELIAQGAWMEPIIAAYGNGLTKEKLAAQCRMYAESDMIEMLPFYSLFEGKSVNLPAAFVEHIYSANGVCAGNTRSEAWVHALSEIMERHCCISYVKSGEAGPVIPDAVLQSFSVVWDILQHIRKAGPYDVTVFDFSLGCGLPVIGTRVTDKLRHTYTVSVCADPVLEIAVERTLTELFQGRTIAGLGMAGMSAMVEQSPGLQTVQNVLNQLETAHGLFSNDFFANELTCAKAPSQFDSPEGHSNQMLAERILAYHKEKGRQVYVRNYSYLGFPCYKFVIPGFSESRGLRLSQPIQAYSFGAQAARTLRDVRNADTEALETLLLYRRMIRAEKSRANFFPFLSGLPMELAEPKYACCMHYACAANRLGRQEETLECLRQAQTCTTDNARKSYAKCAALYLQLSWAGNSQNYCFSILWKLYEEETVAAISSSLAVYGDVFGTLVRCTGNCENCTMRDCCYYKAACAVMAKVGAVYATFTDGQAPESFQC